MKYWETIADNLSNAGWSWGCVGAVDSYREQSGLLDAHRDDGNGFVVRADERLTAFLELEVAIRAGHAGGNHDFFSFSANAAAQGQCVPDGGSCRCPAGYGTASIQFICRKVRLRA